MAVIVETAILTPSEARLRPIMFALMLGLARGRKLYRGVTEGLMEAILLLLGGFSCSYSSLSAIIEGSSKKCRRKSDAEKVTPILAW